MKLVIKSIGVLFILLSLCLAYILQASGLFNKIKPHFDGESETLESPPGIEDLTIDQTNGQVYLSSSDRRNLSKTGDIFTFNSQENAPSYTPLNLSKGNPSFRPHGISLLKKDGKLYLFAISHENETDIVYRFEVQQDSVISQKVFSHELMISPNDLVAIDTSTFYFTNDHGMEKGMERTIKDFLLDKNGYVVLFDDGQANKVSQNIAYPNGINISPDGEYLYVSSTTERTLFVYKNKPNGESLSLLDKRRTNTGLDNIEIDKDGNLLIGAHPKMLKFLGHAKSETNRSPSQVLKFIYLPDTEYKFLQEEIYLNNGNPLSGSSVGAFYQHEDGSNDLFVGSVFESKILRLHRNL